MHSLDRAYIPAGRLARLPRADQAARDEPGGVHRPVRPAGRAGAARRWCSASPRSCASRSAPARAARSTNGMRPTSTRRCADRQAAASRRADGPADGAPLRRRARRLFGAADGPCDQLARGRDPAAVSILFYVLIYTVWLKPRTAQNIVIGGAAGAFPPLIGWVAATGACRRRCRCCCSRSSSCGPRRISGRCRCSSAPIMPPPAIPMLPVVAGVESDAPADLPLQPADGGGGGRALAARPDRPDLRRRAAMPQRRLRRARRRGCSPTARPSRPEWGRRSSLFAYSVFYLFALFAVLVADRWLRMMTHRGRGRSASASASGRGSWRCCSARSSCCCSSSPSPRSGMNW